jgi:hypothetical protein
MRLGHVMELRALSSLDTVLLEPAEQNQVSNAQTIGLNSTISTAILAPVAVTIYGDSTTYTASTGSCVNNFYNFKLISTIGKFGTREPGDRVSSVTILMTSINDMYYIKETYGLTPFGSASW